MAGAASSAAGYCLFLGLVVLSFTVHKFIDPSDLKQLHASQYGLVVGMLVFFAWITVRLSTPTAQQVAQKQQRLKQALQNPGETGLTQTWYDQASATLGRLSTSVLSALVVYLLYWIISVFPLSAGSAWGFKIQEYWDHLTLNHSRKNLFIWGTFIVHMVSFWGLSALFVVLDILRPKSIIQYKIQETAPALTWKALGAAVLLALLNQLILLAILFGLWGFVEEFIPGMFSKDLPPFGLALLQMLAGIPLADLLFYSAHCMLHTNWLFLHVHYIHHTWEAPIAPSAIFAHPVEFIIGNVPVVGAPPIVMGCHMFVWWVWTAAATIDTVHGHSGWQLPFLGGNQGHDYHHVQGHDNLGVTRVLDAAFGTSKTYDASWQKTLDVNYTTPDYPVDKILARAAQAETKAPLV